MKLRMRGSSLRLRLTRSEVEAVGQGKKIEETVEFGPSERLVYAIEPGGEAIAASFGGGRVSVSVPVEVAREWCASDRVGIEGMQHALKILIEKDFACLTHREGEEDVDAFPNPNERC
jgi:hypothetical protein